jgi:DNA-binding PadR family transcriptional regulator
MRIPELSHLQFLVLAQLIAADRTGRQIRAGLKPYRVRQSGPAFYQMMARLEKAGLVSGWYTQEVIDGQIIKERNYRVTAEGRRAWRESLRFYERAMQAAEGSSAQQDGEGGVAHA